MAFGALNIERKVNPQMGEVLRRILDVQWGGPSHLDAAHVATGTYREPLLASGSISAEPESTPQVCPKPRNSGADDVNAGARRRALIGESLCR